MLHSTRCFGSFIEKKTPELYSVICNLFILYYLGLLLKRGSHPDISSTPVQKNLNQTVEIFKIKLDNEELNLFIELN